ncbi:hypothetical protein G3570_00855 [Balneolaceae bacterium YR4-1]|uniref:Long-chain fatty acid transport protein n=1 Tax=Halalkalibaculum roseum TaxID=2709311 RepID=A0A6M1SW05_9BACT|nr:type IX secretion system membrane protein PorP/SprF [Halalkalibaculum roseum]NGP75164.1 hypothetical protein [Halalkalibaculum roseum]
MNRFLYTILVTAVVLSFSSAAYAQQTGDGQVRTGSLYSKVGVGFPIDFGSSAADGMGLNGVSFIEPFVPGLANPAQWGSTGFGLATGGLSLQNFSASSNQGSTSNSTFSADYFQVQLPLKRNKLGVSASLAPLTRSAYQVSETGTRISNDGTGVDTLNYIGVNNSDGGISMLEVGFGWRINNNLSVGYAPSLVFASIDNDFSTRFDDPAFSTVAYTRQTSGIGFGNRFGVLLNASKILKSNDRMSFGAAVSLPVNLDAEKVETSNKRLASGQVQTIEIKDGPSLGDGTIKLPLSVNAGLTYEASRLLSFSTEAIYEKWSQYSNDFNVDGEQLLTDRYKIGMGVRYFPYIIGSNRFLSKFKYRLGASYDTGHIKLEGENIETLMFSIGLGILSPRSRSSVDLSFEYGFRGTESQNLIQENIWGLRLSVNLAELMFFRPKLQ